MEYYYHNWPGPSPILIFNLDRIQKHLPGFVGVELFSTLKPLANRQNVATLFNYYFHRRCSGELHSLVCVAQTFTAMIVDSSSFLSYTIYDEKVPFTQLSTGCLPDDYNFNPCKSRISR